MMKYLAVASALLAAVACTAPPAQPEVSDAAALPVQPDAQPVSDAATGELAASDRSRPVVYGKNEARSPFERETVIRLNAIVQRSLDAINEYDGRRADIIAAADAAAGGDEDARVKAKEGEAFVSGLYDRAKLALDDFKTAENDVKTSGEDYNAAILAGMVTFVTKVEAELRTAKESLAEKLSASAAN